MKLSEQVVNLELSMKLKTLNVKQESLFYWLYLEEPYLSFNINMEIGLGYPKIDEYTCSSFTASELLELLPTHIKGCNLQILKGNRILREKPEFCCRYYDINIISEPDENLSNNCAKILIHLIENKIIEVNNDNKN